jgi:hypothetical protein
MPRGTPHIVIGTLHLAERGFEIHVEGGGIWALDAPRSARKLLGKRVWVAGVRSGFDLLDVEWIQEAGGE